MSVNDLPIELDTEIRKHMDRMLLIKAISDKHPNIQLAHLYKQVMNNQLEENSHLGKGIFLKLVADVSI
jgi:CRISPR/Cas system CSM-associated protein Csm2 small subunit